MAKKTIKSKYTDVPIKSIASGMIELDNKMKVSGVKIMPRNIFILDPATQSAIIFNLKAVYNVIDYDFWIVVADRPVGINFVLFKHKDTDIVQKRVRNLINNFAAAGLTATQTSNDDLRMILDNFLNGGETTSFGTVFA